MPADEEDLQLAMMIDGEIWTVTVTKDPKQTGTTTDYRDRTIRASEGVMFWQLFRIAGRVRDYNGQRPPDSGFHRRDLQG